MSKQTVRLNNANDSWVLNGTAADKSRNYSTSAVLPVRTGGTPGSIYSFLYIANPVPVNANATVVSAKLILRNTQNQAGSRTVTVKPILQAWWLAKLNWNTQPTVGSTTTSLTKSSPVANTVWEFDVTDDIQDAADGIAFRGWRLELSTSALMYFDSSKAVGARAAYKPVLEVTYSLPPDAPTVLAPAGNRAVSVAKPRVRFNFGGQRSINGRQTNNDLQAVQVQVNTTNVWTSPTFDSGTVATSTPELDLSATAYAGLADGASTYWRARVQNDIGQWSAWSAAAQFRRLSKGSLTLDNPPVGGDFTEPTPPVLWTLTGATQQAFQVIVQNAAGTGVYHDSGRVTSTADSYTIPAGVIRTDGQSYNFVLRVWDNQDRETIVGDPAYVEVTRVSQYVFDASVDGVEDFTVTALSPFPGVRLEWSRDTAPDNFAVWRDGVIIYQSVNPSDWNTSGTTYAVDDPYADSNHAHVYMVQAVVNGAGSQDNPEVSGTPRTSGVWLSDLATGIKVHLLGNDEGSWDMPEVSAVMQPLGSRRADVITQTLGGYQGEMSLLATSHQEGDVDDIKADLFRLKEMPGQRLILTLPTMTLQVVISDLKVTPTPRAGEEYKVSFKFYEQDGFRFDAGF